MSGLRPAAFLAPVLRRAGLAARTTGSLPLLLDHGRPAAGLRPTAGGYTIEVVGQAVVDSAQGRSHRTIAADLGLPDDTVRGWIRKVSGRAEWRRATGTAAAHMFDAMFDPPPPTETGSPLAEAISALGAAVAAARRMFGPIATHWEFLAVIAHGQLLAPLRSD